MVVILWKHLSVANLQHLSPFGGSSQFLGSVPFDLKK